MTTENASLKLKAKDAEDIQVIAAILQDAIVPIGDMTYDAAAKKFILVVNRFRWERMNSMDGDQQPACERICCAVHIEGVADVKTQQLDLTARGTMLDLLTLMVSDNALLLVFAGGARLRLAVDDWSMKLEDFGEPWPVTCTPCHDRQHDAG
jgi:hypothetical protein